MKVGIAMTMAALALGAFALPNGFLVADGTRMVQVGTDGKKTPYVLKGTNAGSWLLTEDWMTLTSLTSNLKGEHGQYELSEKFVEKFGEAKAKELFKLYRDKWWQEADFDNVKALGLNCLRLPFGWRDFLDETGRPNSEGFTRMDWFVRNCKQRGLYVILDMHGAPGSQNGRHHSGDTRNPRLFTEKASMDLCIKIWQSIARRYRGNPTIAAYDLLNEPEGHPGGHTTDAAVIEGLDRLYKAVRAVDPDHLIMIESCWDTPQLPSPSKFGWKNVCYQYHFYCWDGVNKSDRQAEFIASKLKNEEQTRHGVPVFIGEFTFFDDPKSWNLALKTFNEQGWGWTTWSYKIHHAKSSWGIYNSANGRGKDNVATPADDYETVKAKWSKLDTATSFHENKWLADIIRAHAR